MEVQSRHPSQALGIASSEPSADTVSSNHRPSQSTPEAVRAPIVTEIRVLVVEDNDGDYVLAREMLADLEQQECSQDVRFSVRRAVRLEEALRMLRSESIEAILLDLSLPDAQGLEAFTRLKQELPERPIVVFTGMDDINIAKQALADGAQDYLVKGFVDAGLLARAVVYSIERKRADEERRALEHRLLNAQKLESLGVMAGGLAHDLNNVLQGILSYTNLAIGGVGPAGEVRGKLMQIERLVGHAAELVDNLFACSGRVRFSSGGLNISQFTAETLDLIRPTIRKNLRFRVQLATNLPYVEVDAIQVRQVLTNLVMNAVEACEESSIITVRTGVERTDGSKLPSSYLDEKLPEGFYVYLEVSDTGSGMDATTRRKIFEPFFTTKRCGRGLGLASVLGIIRGYKGTIRVESNPGRGSSFRVLLPCQERELAN